MEKEAGNMAADQMLVVRANSWTEKNAAFHLLPRSCRPEPASSTRFKGVVLQKNGNWGAQIFADHQRLWLGTFESESSAAVAYDRAATKIRSSDDPDRNFSDLISPYEMMFQDIQTTDAVLGMIRDGSYESKLAQFLSATGDSLLEGAGHPLIAENDGGAGARELFHKELTPSDVGKLNRLVIPKKHALKYFPRIETNNRERAGGRRAGGLMEDGGTTEGIMLEFRDLQDRPWEFRYCYWKSSQSFVFTKGWNKFVKRKKLRAKDVVTFYRCENREGSTKAAFSFLIGVGHGGARRRDEGDSVGCGVGGGARGVREWGLNPAGIGAGKLFEFGSRIAVPSSSRGPEEEQTEEGEETLELATTTASGLEEKRGVRLFGVLIGER